jgi:hypothetical protein
MTILSAPSQQADTNLPLIFQISPKAKLGCASWVSQDGESLRGSAFEKTFTHLQL